MIRVELTKGIDGLLIVNATNANSGRKQQHKVTEQSRLDDATVAALLMENSARNRESHSSVARNNNSPPDHSEGSMCFQWASCFFQEKKMP